MGAGPVQPVFGINWTRFMRQTIGVLLAALTAVVRVAGADDFNLKNGDRVAGGGGLIYALVPVQ
jgi:hypothetical protein